MDEAGKPEAATAEPPTEIQVAGLSCPSCSGALSVESGLRNLSCPYCDTHLLALGEVGVRRFAVRPEIDATRARSLVRDWFKKGLRKDRRLPKEAEAAETFLCFLPFFRVRVDVLGVVLGTEERRRTRGSGKNRRTETYQVDVEKKVDRHFDRTFPAVNVAEWGVQRVDLAGDRVVPFDGDELRRLGMVFPPTGSEAEVRRQAFDAFLQEADPSRRLKVVRYRFLRTLRERLTVVFYPLWVVRYRFQGRAYQAVIDAEDGSLSYGKAPGNDLYRAVMLVLCQAVACFIGTTILQFSVSGGDDLIGGLIFAVIAVVGILFWGWRSFRYGGEIEEGTGLKKGKKGAVPKPLRKVLDQAGLDQLDLDDLG